MNLLIIFDNVFNDFNCLEEYFMKNKEDTLFVYSGKLIQISTKTMEMRKSQGDFYKYFCDNMKTLNVKQLNNIDNILTQLKTIDKVCIFTSRKDNKTVYDELKDNQSINEQLSTIPVEHIISAKKSSFVYFKSKEIKTEMVETTYKKLGLTPSQRYNKTVQSKFKKMKAKPKKKKKKDPPKPKTLLKQEKYFI